MDYYKWVLNDSPTIYVNPGSVFMSKAVAIDFLEQFKSWVDTEDQPLGLYRFSGVEPTIIETAFDSRLLFYTQVEPLSAVDRDLALAYFASKPSNFFGTNLATEEDVILWRRLVMLVGCLRSAGPFEGDSVAKYEAYYAKPATLRLILRQS